MRTYYNRIAGQSLERLAALSDGIFAVTQLRYCATDLAALSFLMGTVHGR